MLRILAKKLLQTSNRFCSILRFLCNYSKQFFQNCKFYGFHVTVLQISELWIHFFSIEIRINHLTVSTLGTLFSRKVVKLDFLNITWPLYTYIYFKSCLSELELNFYSIFLFETVFFKLQILIRKSHVLNCFTFLLNGFLMSRDRFMFVWFGNTLYLSLKIGLLRSRDRFQFSKQISFLRWGDRYNFVSPTQNWTFKVTWPFCNLFYLKLSFKPKNVMQKLRDWVYNFLLFCLTDFSEFGLLGLLEY